MWLTSIQVNDQPHKAVIYYGDKIEITLSCMSEAETNGFVGLVLTDQDGGKTINANNRYQRNILRLSNGVNAISCKLGMVPLMEGTYYLTIYLGDESRDIQVIENAVVIEVHEKDVWGNGKLPPRRVSSFWWNTEFKLERI